MARPKLKDITPKYVPLWRFETPYGVVSIYRPNNEECTVERANYLLDCAKLELLKGGGEYS